MKLLPLIPALLCQLAPVLADSFGSGAIEIEFVEVGVPGNPADTTGYGTVAQEFRISKYEISEGMIAAYNAATTPAITTSIAGPNKPAAMIDWNEAARFANWLNTSNGHPPAYKFTSSAANAQPVPWSPSDPGYDPSNLLRSSLAGYFLPSEDEWYKAAFFDPLSGLYFAYTASSDSVPGKVLSGTDPGTAVYGWGGMGTPADIDQSASLGPFGTLGQGGNIHELCESSWSGTPGEGSAVIIHRGGSYKLGGWSLASDSRVLSDALRLGFRVASLASLGPQDLEIELPGTGLLNNGEVVDLGLQAPDSVGSSVNLILRNVSDVAVTLYSVILSSGDLEDFVLEPVTPGISLAPSATIPLTVTFQPQDAGEKSVELEISSDSSLSSLRTINFTGTGTGPELAVFDALDAPLVHDESRKFGSIPLGESKTMVFSVVNEGNSQLTISGISKVGGNTDAFSILSTPSSVLAPDGSGDIEIEFAPDSEGPMATTLRIRSDDPDSDPFDIRLSARGVAPPAGTVITDGAWTAMGEYPGVNGYVETIVRDGNGNAYVGGVFTVAGGVEARNIARWDGSSWVPLGEGANDEISALAFNGNLYAAGKFTEVGGISANYVAKWDGVAWSALGSGLPDEVAALVIGADGKLYAGGRGGVHSYPLSSGSAGVWSDLGLGSGGIAALGFDGSGVLYAGGDFTGQGALAGTGNLAMWDGSSWSPVPGFLAITADDYVNAIAVNSTGTLYIGGRLHPLPGAPSQLNNLMWMSSPGIWSFSSQGFDATVGSTEGEVFELACDSLDRLYVGGNFEVNSSGGKRLNVERLFGVDPLPFFGCNFVRALSPGAGDDLMIGASNNLNIYFTSPLSIESWPEQDRRLTYGFADLRSDGWQSPGTGPDLGIDCATYDSAGNLYVGGLFSYIGGIEANGLAMWDGTDWSALGSGIDDGEVRTMIVADNGDLIIGGKLKEVGGTTVSNVARWDGTSWHRYEGTFNNPYFDSVADLKFDASGQLYAGGDFEHIDGENVGPVVRWTGTQWVGLGDGPGDGSVSTMVFDPDGLLYVGGGFEPSTGVFKASDVHVWDGTSWTALPKDFSSFVSGDPDDSVVRALACDSGGNVYAGGTFLHTSSLSYVNRIAMWDGSSWSGLGGGMDAKVSTLFIDGQDRLFAAGGFTTAGGVATGPIALWENENWSAITSGIDAEGVRFAPGPQGRIAVFGSFIYAAGSISPGLTEFTIPSSPPVPFVEFSIVDLPSGQVELFGCDSIDFGGEIVGYEWSWSGGTASGDQVIVTLPFGTTEVTLEVTDSEGNAATQSVSITLETLADALDLAGLEGTAREEDAVPFGDGVENLLKYAFNMNLGAADSSTLVAGTGVSGLPTYQLVDAGPETVIEVQYIRRKGSGLNYIPQKSGDLSTGSFELLNGIESREDIDGVFERVTVVAPCDPAVEPQCFWRVAVTQP